MHLQYAVKGLLFLATVTAAFNPSVPHEEDGKKDWKPIKIPRSPFVPEKGLGEGKAEDWQPVQPRQLKLKRIPEADTGLHPEIRAIQAANSLTKRYQKRGVPGPNIDGALAIRNVLTSLEKRGLMKRQSELEILQSKDPVTPNSMAVHQDGSDYSYFSEINFGSENKTFLLVIDTGSSDTWVPSSDCRSAACRTHSTFGPQDSSTLKVTTKRWSIQYGTGSASGVVASDDISFAGFRINVDFGLSTVVSDDFVYYPIDGILGLGFKEASQQGADTILDVLVQNKLIGSRIFGVALSRASEGNNDGVIHFGGVFPQYYEGNLVFSKSSSQWGLWEIAIDDFGIDNKTLGFKSRSAIIDTGTSLMLIPPEDAITIHEQVTGARTNGESFGVPCDTNRTLYLSFSGVQYEIPAKDWVGEVISTSLNLCLSGIVGRQIANDASVWLVGDVFLKNVYAAFDMDNNRIGFGKRVQQTDQNGSATHTTATATFTGTLSDLNTSQPPTLSPTTSGSDNDPVTTGGTNNGASAAGSVKVPTFVGLVAGVAGAVPLFMGC